jgi:site-specific DNA recombinase
MLRNASFGNCAGGRGWEPVRIYREEGRSTHVDAIARRPVFRQLLEDTSKGDFDVVVVHTLDRWARNQRVMLEAFAILGKNNVGLVSITEHIDYSTPQGKLFTQMLGSFAEYFSESLATHIRKGLEQRIAEGKHAGGIPFGYESCWTDGEKGEKKRRCNPEHPARIHIHPKEGVAVTELFTRYSSGLTTLSQLTAWLNEQGFRTRNMHSLTGPDGKLSSGPRLFTTSSVRGILHNPFYTAQIRHNEKLVQGIHEPLVSREVFEIVQTTLKKNSGRSETLQVRPERHYLLKGIIRCAYCGMPMWAQTYTTGKPFYREHKASRSHGNCPGGGSILCSVVDSQISSLVEAIELGPQWLEEVLSIISLKDEVDQVKKRRQVVQEKIRRMGKAYIDGVFPDEEYHRQKKLLEMESESLVIPQANAAEEAGKLINDLPRLCLKANQEERRKLLLSMLDAVYVDAKQTKSIVAIKPKPPFKPVFQVAASRKGSNIRILNEPLNGSSVFLVETGESRTPRPEEAVQDLLQA